MVDDKTAQFEAWTNLDPLFPPSFVMDDDKYETAKELAEDGYDYEYLMQHTVESIKEKYREQLLKDALYTDKDPNFEDRLMYSAACLRLDAGSREIPKGKVKDVKLKILCEF